LPAEIEPEFIIVPIDDIELRKEIAALPVLVIPPILLKVSILPLTNITF
jgi:hypothetical protein